MINVGLKTKTNSRKTALEYVFYTIATLFVVSMIRTSTLTPQLLNATNALKYDCNDEISNPDQRQIALIGSYFGLSNPVFLIAIMCFIALGIYIFISPDGKKLRKPLIQVFTATITTSGILITIFSVWRAS